MKQVKIINPGFVYTYADELIPEQYRDKYAAGFCPEKGSIAEVLGEIQFQIGCMTVDNYVCDGGGHVFLIDKAGAQLCEYLLIGTKIRVTNRNCLCPYAKTHVPKRYIDAFEPGYTPEEGQQAIIIGYSNIGSHRRPVYICDTGEKVWLS